MTVSPHEWELNSDPHGGIAYDLRFGATAARHKTVPALYTTGGTTRGLGKVPQFGTS